MSTERKRVLSIDGGGIYGLTSALWLRKLCEAEPTFLDGNDIHLFAGCSSGAVNALLLARHARPRDAVLGGELERFWHDPGTFTNSNPIGQMLAWFELSAWYGERDFLDLLLRHFGEMKLGELPHRVLITTFNWHGGRPKFPPLTAGEQASTNPAGTFFRDLSAWRDRIPAVADPVPAGQRRRWHPEMFTNEEGSGYRDYHVADVAYGAATPPGFRALRGGIGDGASFSASPSVDAVAHVIAQERKHAEAGARRLGGLTDVLASISVLSLGDGTFSPFHFLPNANLGFGTWGIVPTNPLEGVFLSPSAYSLQPADQQATQIAQELLGEGFFRLNPPIMGLPTVPAAYMARWPAWRTWILSQVQLGIEKPDSLDRVAAATKFLRSEEWLGHRAGASK